MNKYVILVVLNSPFIVYALAKSIIYFKEGIYSKMQLSVRLIFWLTALAGMIFAKPLYDFLVHKDLTDSAPLSLADVLLTTACFLSLTMLIRLYARVDRAERNLTDLNQALTLRDVQK
jgi:hypothetical protein